MFNNVIEGSIGASASAPVNAVIIKNIPLTIVNDIQAIVLYHRGGPGNVGRAIGFTIELYNNDTEYDPNLLSPLATTTPITIGLRGYRYDFPSFDTYTLGFSDDTSISQLPLETYDGSTWNSIIRDVPTINIADVNINSNVNITGGLSVDTITTSGTQINFNSDSFISNTAGSNSGNHLVIFVNGTEYKIKLENAS